MAQQTTEGAVCCSKPSIFKQTHEGFAIYRDVNDVGYMTNGRAVLETFRVNLWWAIAPNVVLLPSIGKCSFQGDFLDHVVIGFS